MCVDVGEIVADLDFFASYDKGAVAWACYDWLQINSAGLPYVPLVEQSTRSDARYWAELATPSELECYALAACDKLADEKSMFAGRQIKRLVGGLWKRMSPQEQAAFFGWIKKQMGETDEC